MKSWVVYRKPTYADDWTMIVETTDRQQAIQEFDAQPADVFSLLCFRPYGDESYEAVKRAHVPHDSVPLSAFFSGLRHLVNVVDPGMQFIPHEVRSIEEDR